MGNKIDLTTVVVAIIAGLPAMIAAIATLIITIQSAKKVELVHVATNSIKDALIKSTRDQALLEGHEAGRIVGVADEKARQNEIKLQSENER